MKLRNKKTGEIIDIDIIENRKDGSWEWQAGKTLHDLNREWEDYEPKEPFFDEKIRKAIRAWWEMQDNPFRAASVLCNNDRKDDDGFYNYRIFGYIVSGKCRTSTDLEFRTKKYYKYDAYHDYSKEELCGEEK